MLGLSSSSLPAIRDRRTTWLLKALIRLLPNNQKSYRLTSLKSFLNPSPTTRLQCDLHTCKRWSCAYNSDNSPPPFKCVCSIFKRPVLSDAVVNSWSGYAATGFTGLTSAKVLEISDIWIVGSNRYFDPLNHDRSFNDSYSHPSSESPFIKKLRPLMVAKGNLGGGGGRSSLGGCGGGLVWFV